MSLRENDLPAKNINNNRRKFSSNSYKSPNRATILKYFMDGIHFPTVRSQLVKIAESKNAPRKILAVLAQFSEKKYYNIIDISAEAGKTLLEDIV